MDNPAPGRYKHKDFVDLLNKGPNKAALTHYPRFAYRKIEKSPAPTDYAVPEAKLKIAENKPKYSFGRTKRTDNFGARAKLNISPGVGTYGTYDKAFGKLSSPPRALARRR